MSGDFWTTVEHKTPESNKSVRRNRDMFTEIAHIQGTLTASSRGGHMLI